MHYTNRPKDADIYIIYFIYLESGCTSFEAVDIKTVMKPEQTCLMPEKFSYPQIVNILVWRSSLNVRCICLGERINAASVPLLIASQVCT